MYIFSIGYAFKTVHGYLRRSDDNLYTFSKKSSGPVWDDILANVAKIVIHTFI